MTILYYESHKRHIYALYTVNVTKRHRKCWELTKASNGSNAKQNKTVSEVKGDSVWNWH